MIFAACLQGRNKNFCVISSQSFNLSTPPSHLNIEDFPTLIIPTQPKSEQLFQNQLANRSNLYFLKKQFTFYCQFILCITLIEHKLHRYRQAKIPSSSHIGFVITNLAWQSLYFFPKIQIENLMSESLNSPNVFELKLEVRKFVHGFLLENTVFKRGEVNCFQDFGDVPPSPAIY